MIWHCLIYWDIYTWPESAHAENSVLFCAMRKKTCMSKDIRNISSPFVLQSTVLHVIKHFLRNCHKWQDYTEGNRDKPASMEMHNNLARHIRAPTGSAAPPQQGYRCLCSTTAQIWCSPVIWDQTAVKELGEQDLRGASFEASLASLRSHSSSLRG